MACGAPSDLREFKMSMYLSLSASSPARRRPGALRAVDAPYFHPVQRIAHDEYIIHSAVGLPHSPTVHGAGVEVCTAFSGHRPEAEEDGGGSERRMEDGTPLAGGAVLDLLLCRYW